MESMDRRIESKCRDLVENYRVLAAGNKMEFSEMILACAGIYLAAGIRPEMSKVQESKKILKSKAGIFSNFRGSDELYNFGTDGAYMASSLTSNEAQGYTFFFNSEERGCYGEWRFDGFTVRAVSIDSSQDINHDPYGNDKNLDGVTGGDDDNNSTNIIKEVYGEDKKLD